jgi:hypothetical protein
MLFYILQKKNLTKLCIIRRFIITRICRPMLRHYKVRTDCSLAEKLWLICGVMGDVMLCDRERDIHPSQKFYVTIHSKELLFSQYFCSANINFQQLYVFTMNNKASPPSTNPTKKCRALFPYFPSLESRLAGEDTVGEVASSNTNFISSFIKLR